MTRFASSSRTASIILRRDARHVHMSSRRAHDIKASMFHEKKTPSETCRRGRQRAVQWRRSHGPVASTHATERYYSSTNIRVALQCTRPAPFLAVKFLRSLPPLNGNSNA